MKRFSLLFFAAAFFCFSLTCQEEEGVLFQYRQKAGESSVHVSTIEEEAYFNNQLNNKTEIVNRTSTTVLENYDDGSALLDTHYMTTQNSILAKTDNHLSWGEEDQVQVVRMKNGIMTKSNNEFLPTVRNLPVFPAKKVKPGETWKASGKEVHDLRELFSMDKALELPFTASYSYLGEKEINGQIFSLISVYYDFFKNVQNSSNYSLSSRYGTFASASGFTRQKIYWNKETGEIDHYTESFQIKLMDTYGNSYLFKSEAHGEVLEYKSVNDEENLNKIKDTIADLQLDDISIKQGEKGLTISLDRIQFEPDSNILMESEKEKIRKISQLLSEYPNDLLITGHCALRGTENARQLLSEQRAEAVASYLEELGVRDKLHIFTQGKGAEEPVASNDTEEGRALNRRVEITLMD